MGTNIYIQRKKPRMVPCYDKVHVAKLSYGWRAHFDGSSRAGTSWEHLSEEAPRIGSMDDLRGYLETDEFELVDENGHGITLDEVLAHDRQLVDGEPHNVSVSMDDYYDREGYPWSRREFC